jgi:hypothetical protein
MLKEKIFRKKRKKKTIVDKNASPTYRVVSVSAIIFGATQPGLPDGIFSYQKSQFW